ncbi:hypothetical protein AB0O80_01165 [Rothia kristinae]|uniref:hypothetical protein n=1 Tax=Rothia kristinae TaxID=37923 RepID=UPI0034279965
MTIFTAAIIFAVCALLFTFTAPVNNIFNYSTECAPVNKRVAYARGNDGPTAWDKSSLNLETKECGDISVNQNIWGDSPDRLQYRIKLNKTYRMDLGYIRFPDGSKDVVNIHR